MKTKGMKKLMLLLPLLALAGSFASPRTATADYCYGPFTCPPDMYWSCSSCYCYCPANPGEPEPWGTCGACV